MSLIVKIGADIRDFDREMRRMTRDINGVSKKLSDAGKSMTTALTAPLAGIAAIATKTGMGFEASMSQVAATLGTTTDKIGDLEKLAMDMGSSTKFSASEAAEGINYMAMAGWKTQDIMEGLPSVLNLAAAGGMELGAASDIVTDAMTGMGIGASGAGDFVDLMAKTSSNANTSVRDMGAAMILVAGQANALAIEQDDLAQAIGLMANAGFKGEIAGQHLSAGIRALVNPQKKQQKYMEKYGIELQKNADGGMDLGATMEHLREKLSSLDRVTQAQVMAVLLGADAQKSWSAIINASEKDFDKLSSAIADSEGAGKQMADTMSNNLEGRMKAMQSALEGVAIQIYEYLQPALEEIVSVITKAAKAFSNLSPKTQTFIVALAAIVAAVGPLLIAFSAVLKMFGFIKGALSMIGIAAMGSVGIWIAVGLAIAALVLAIIIYWDEIKAATIKTWNAVSKFMKELWSEIVDVAKEKWASLTSFFTELWSGIKEKTESAWNSIKDFFSEWGLTILAVITGPLGWITGLIVMYWDEIKAATETVWNAIKSFLSTIWSGIVAVFGPIFNVIYTVISSIWNGIKTVTLAVWNFITQYLKAIWDALMYFVKPVFDKIHNYISGVWNKVKAISSAVWNVIKAYITNVWKNISATAKVVWNAISAYFTIWLNRVKTVMTVVWKAIQVVTSSVWNSIKTIAVKVWNSIKNSVMGPVEEVKDKTTSSFDTLKTRISNIFKAVKVAAAAVWNSISSTVSNIVGKLVEKVGGAFGSLKGIIVGAWEGVKSGMKTVINGIISMVNKFIGGFNSPAKLLNKIPGVDAPTIPKIPMLATGGTIFGNGQAIVGEAGPELVSKSGSSVKVTPLSSQEKAGGIGGAMGGSGGGVVEVPVSLDGKVIARVVAPYMDNQLRGRRDSKNRSKGGW